MKQKRLIAIIACVLASAFALAGCNGKKADFNVGICQLVTHDALDAATQGFKDALTEELKKEGKTVSFNEQNAAGDSATCSTIVNGFVSANVDLIMANATPALQAASNATETIPILGTSITDYGVALGLKNYSGVVGGNVSGTSDLAPLDKQAEMFAELLPNANKIGLLYCSAEPNSLYQVQTVEKYLKDKGKTTERFAFTDSNDISAVVTRAYGSCDAIYIPTDNTAASNGEIIKNVCYPTSGKVVPIIAGEEGICKACGIATLSISYYNIGKKTGEMAAKILLGKEDISKLAVAYDESPVYKYNEELCQKAGITVPSGYEKI